jgi:4-hydroxy-3-polyprenylbenzoate decarboxylase
MREVRDNFDPHFDFVMIPRVPLDTLDFTSYTMNLGSKMVIDATKKPRAKSGEKEERKARARKRITGIRSADRRILDVNFVHDALLLVKVRGQGMSVLRNLVKHPALQDVPLVAMVSVDVDIRDREKYIWGVFTRFDCERDIRFAEQRLIGISPVYEGVMGIDATWKPGYPETLEMTGEVRKRVEERWESYWR